MSPLKTVFIPHWDGRYLCSWDLQQMLISAELSLRSCQLRRQSERAGPYSEAMEKSLEVVLGHARGSEGPPCPAPWAASSSPKEALEVSRGRAPTATQTWASAASHKTPQKQEKSPMNVKLKKAAALRSIFGMNWRILLFQLQPTCWFSSAALLFCSLPFPGLS